MLEQFKIVTTFFEKESIEYAVIGALALHAYGYTRATKDIDFITRYSNQTKIIEYLESLGFETLHFSEGYSNHLLSIDLTRFDFVYVDEKTAGNIFKNIIRKKFNDRLTLPVVCPEHLIALKLFSLKNDPDRKYRELADLKELINRVAINIDLLDKNDFDDVVLSKLYEEIILKNTLEE